MADSIEFEVVDGMSFPRTFVFFRLMVSPKSLQACEKQSVNGVPPGFGSQLLHHQQTACP